jgi:hypothetical protein
MSKKQHTPKQRFIRYLLQMLHWQSLPRDSAERAAAQRAWLAQGQHTGGNPRKAESSTDEGQHSKQQRDGWKLGWRERIRDDPELSELADEAGVLDNPRADVLPGDFANPDPRVYKAVTPGVAVPPKEEPRPKISIAEALRRWGRRKPE